MPTKLSRKTLPSGTTQNDFTYMGRPAKDQGDFGTDVGIADLACVNQFGEANNAKYYHGGVVQSSKGGWYVYLEWGRMKSARSWNGSFGGGDYQFVQCADEEEARKFFAKQLNSKNIKRLVEKKVGAVTIWAAKAGKDGYLVQKLATREKGLPDAYKIKDDSGVKKTTAASKPNITAAAPAKPSRVITFQPEVIKLAKDLVGGTQTYTRSLAEASGVTPTQEAIDQVRDQLVPAALRRIKIVGNRIERQVQDSDLRDITKMVQALVPRPIPRGGMAADEAILSGNNLMVLQSDLDAFEAALRNENFDMAVQNTGYNPNTALNAELRWIDLSSKEGRWLVNAFQGMTRNRHGHLRGKARIRNIYAVTRDDRDAQFLKAVQQVAKSRRGRYNNFAKLQPRRIDLDRETAQLYKEANVFLGIHGTRSVNVGPILQTNLRLPRSLPGAKITGAAFGHGIYFATDWKKSHGYTGHGSYWTNGGKIAGRGWFMFLGDVVMGDAYMTRSTGSWSKCPGGKDSVAAYPEFCRSLVNDEHIIFNPDFQRIRYVIEATS